MLKHYFLLKMGTGNGGTWIRMCSNEGVEKTEVKQALHRGQITENPSEARFFFRMSHHQFLENKNTKTRDVTFSVIIALCA